VVVGVLCAWQEAPSSTSQKKAPSSNWHICKSKAKNWTLWMLRQCVVLCNRNIFFKKSENQFLGIIIKPCLKNIPFLQSGVVELLEIDLPPGRCIYDHMAPFGWNYKPAEKHCCWFFVREKYCSGWKNKPNKTDYKPDEQVCDSTSCVLCWFLINECMDALLNTFLPSEAKVVPSTLNKFHMRGLSLHARICILF
jgi:hypothetical protein